MRGPGTTAVLLATTCAVLWGCSGEPDAPPPEPAPAPAKPEAPLASEAPEIRQLDLVQRGRQVYMSNCIACHNTDPSQDGALGPAIAGSSEALLRARVIENEYPPGYTPKRDTKAMIPLPHLEPDIPALFAFLNQ